MEKCFLIPENEQISSEIKLHSLMNENEELKDTITYMLGKGVCRPKSPLTPSELDRYKQEMEYYDVARNMLIRNVVYCMKKDKHIELCEKFKINLNK